MHTDTWPDRLTCEVGGGVDERHVAGIVGYQQPVERLGEQVGQAVGGVQLSPILTGEADKRIVEWERGIREKGAGDKKKGDEFGLG